MALSFVLGHILEGLIIFGLLTANAIIGYVHARGSRQAVELLKRRLAAKARVLRDGKWMTAPAAALVPGDIILVRLGDIVPADAKVISGGLTADESALTGESLPRELAPSGIVYSGSVVRQGEATCLAVNTGTRTYFGRTAELVKVARPVSHQAEVMLAVVKYMMYLGIAASALVAFYALLLHLGVLVVATFVVIFLLGAVPVALPAVMTIVQSVGAMELSRKGVLVTRLDAVEDAASITVVCFDKTGTITENRLAVVDRAAFNPYQPGDVLAVAALASRAEGDDPIDLAVLQAARSSGVDLTAYQSVSFTPFDPARRRTEAVVEFAHDRFKAVKGAARTVLSLGAADAALTARVNAAADAFSARGFRTIAVARSRGGIERIELVGLLALADPLRPDSAAMIAEVGRLGIKPVMLTGDGLAIAREVAREAGIAGEVRRYADVRDLDEAAQSKAVEQSSGFAEIYPEDKFHIVKLLQSRGHVVGMTGDGVNDAPALKQAEMGIAVSSATDVARAAASVVLTRPGLGVIVDAVKMSRQTYQRMLTWVINKEIKVMGFVGVLTLGFFWLRDVVVSLLGMSLIVFANDFVTMSLATDNVHETSNPNQWNVRNVTLAAAVPALLLVGEGMLVVALGASAFHLAGAALKALVMLNFVFASQFRVLSVRERRHLWSSRPGTALLVSSTATLVAFTLLGCFGVFARQLTAEHVLTVLVLSAVLAVLIDFPKYYLFRKFGL
jgi:H+-transporting ATPase